MTWIDSYFNIAKQILHLDNSLKILANHSYCIETNALFDKMLKLMIERQKILLKYKDYHILYDCLNEKIKLLLNLKYIKNFDIESICKKLQIAKRTYHRYMCKIKQLGENYEKQQRII